MDRDQLIAEIKRQLQEELKGYTRPLTDKISDERKDQVVEIKNEVSAFVKENPWWALGAVAVAGFMLGRFLYKQGDE